MVRNLVAVVLATALLAAVLPGAGAETPPPPVKITLSTYNAGAGEPLTVYFRGAELASHRIEVFIDRPSNGVGYVVATSTGYGRKTFTLSRYARANSRHSIGLLDTKTRHTYRRAFAVDCDVIGNGVPGCL